MARRVVALEDWDLQLIRLGLGTRRIGTWDLGLGTWSIRTCWIGTWDLGLSTCDLEDWDVALRTW